VRFPQSWAELRQRVQDLRNRGSLGFQSGELRHFLGCMLRIAVSCQERRLAEYEKITWWEFVGAGARSDAYKKLLARGLTRSLVAMRAEVASTRTVGDIMLQMLERRLDNAVYRIGFATSRAFARQLVRHGHIRVNGKKVNIPSFQVKPGDEVSVRDKSKENVSILAAREATAHLTSPSWLEVDRENLKARVVSLPKREELVQINLNEQLIVELYSK
jgi:ribosomal protein S4